MCIGVGMVSFETSTLPRPVADRRSARDPRKRRRVACSSSAPTPMQFGSRYSKRVTPTPYTLRSSGEGAARGLISTCRALHRSVIAVLTIHSQRRCRAVKQRYAHGAQRLLNASSHGRRPGRGRSVTEAFHRRTTAALIHPGANRPMIHASSLDRWRS